MSIQEVLNSGLQFHQSGRLAEAEAAYRRVLDAQPKHPDALHLCGVLYTQTGRPDEGLDMIRRAINLNPSAAHYHDNLGVALAALGQDEQAITAHRRAVALKPSFAEAHNHLGHALMEKGRLAEAIASFHQSIKLSPDYAEAYNNLGNALTQAGQFSDAVTACRTAVALNPEFAEAHNSLGNALCQAGELEAAVAAHERAVQLRPNDPEALVNLAIALRQQEKFVESMAACLQALMLRPDHSEANNNLGIGLFHTGEVEQAMAAYRRTLATRPDHFHALANLGSALFASGDLDQAADYYRRALKLNPEHASGHWNFGLLLLTRGDFERGWPEYEWRWKIKEFALQGTLTKPLWDGSDLSGRRILLYAEQGFGDALQFVRYLPRISERGGAITMIAPPELHRLLRQFTQVSQWASPGDPTPEHDVYCPLLTLARIFGTNANNIPASVPYITAEAALVESWKKRMPADGRKVGLVWAGRPTHFNDRNRSFQLSALGGLASVRGVRFFSLQKGAAASQARSSPMELTDWTEELNDFADTAALVANLDLVITADTSVAHLAGALGKPVWVLLPFVPDWRWMLNRADSPWYPTMRLFRQPRAGDWATPIAQIAEALESLK